MSDSKLLVLVGPDFGTSAPALWGAVPTCSAATDAEVEAAYDHHRPSIVVLHGGDPLVSRAVTIWHRCRERRARPVQFVPVPVDPESPVTRAVGSTERLGKFAKLLLAQGVNMFERISLMSLALVDSGLASRRLGFSAGFGLFADDGFARTEVVERALSGRRDQFRMTIDGSPTRTPGYLLASTLSETFAKVPMGDGLRYRVGDQPAALLAQTTRLGRFVTRATGIAGAQSFSRIHIDGASGYLLDGIVQEVERPGVLELRAGPRVSFVKVR